MVFKSHCGILKTNVLMHFTSRFKAYAGQSWYLKVIVVFKKQMFWYILYRG